MGQYYVYYQYISKFENNGSKPNIVLFLPWFNVIMLSYYNIIISYTYNANNLLWPPTPQKCTPNKCKKNVYKWVYFDINR